MLFYFLIWKISQSGCEAITDEVRLIDDLSDWGQQESSLTYLKSL